MTNCAVSYGIAKLQPEAIALQSRTAKKCGDVLKNHRFLSLFLAPLTVAMGFLTSAANEVLMVAYRFVQCCGRHRARNASNSAGRRIPDKTLGGQLSSPLASGSPSV